MKQLLKVLSILLAVTGVVIGASADEPEDPPPPVGVTAEQHGPLRIVDAVLAGELIAAAPLPEAFGRGVAVLIVPETPESVETAAGGEDEDAEDQPRCLIRVELISKDATTATSNELLCGLDPEIRHLARVGDDLLLGENGIVHRLSGSISAPTLEPLIVSPGASLGSLVAGDLLTENVRALPSVGQLSILRDGTELGTVALPQTARRTSHGLELASPSVTRIKGDALTFAVGPQAAGRTRLRSQLIKATDTGLSTVEAWSRLPAAEIVESSWYLRLDDQDVLIVTTTSADKLGLFEKLKLRLFPLSDDRTRKGRLPTLAIETKTRRWYDVDPHIDDIDGDGHDDLILIQPEGLGAGKLMVDAYLGKGNSRFESKPKRATVDSEGASWLYGHDFNGDQIADLLLAKDDGLELYPGVRGDKKRFLAKSPAWTLPPTLFGNPALAVEVTVDTESDVESVSISAHPVAADLDHDGRSDFYTPTEVRGRAVVRLVLVGSN